MSASCKCSDFCKLNLRLEIEAEGFLNFMSQLSDLSNCLKIGSYFHAEIILRLAFACVNQDFCISQVSSFGDLP
jgi:hypothetical protein